jgi:amidohydrolase
VDAIFGLHVFPYETGSIVFKPAGIMAASDNLDIKVRGSQTHGALPWAGVDPVVVGSQIVLGLQTIVSRQEDLTVAPAIVTIGSFHGGTRRNIIPDEVQMQGTIRTFDRKMREDVHARIKRTAEQIAAAAGATAEVSITGNNPVTYNDPALTARMTPSLERVAPGQVNPNGRVTTAAEDFAAYQEKVPGLFFFLGITPKDADPKTVAPNHSPRFFADEGALVTGVRAMASLAVDFLAGTGK